LFFIFDTEKKEMYKKAHAIENLYSCDEISENRIKKMEKALKKARELDIATQPFEKFIEECDLYVNLLKESIKFAENEASVSGGSEVNTSILVDIRESVDKAKTRFKALGGAEEQMDRLKAWVADPNKEKIPAWLPGFLTRYYKSRTGVMKKLKERHANTLRDAQLMPSDVKPPLKSPNDPNAVTVPATEKTTTQAPKRKNG
jgi:hypothetical protein